jgi:hypothetical protein
MDIFVSGVGSQAIVSVLYENDEGSFSNTNQTIAGFTKGACAWADYDNDGDFDLIVAGAEGGVSNSASTLYKNANNIFSPVQILGGDTLPPLSFPSVDWGDYDNDGDMDILLTGQIGILAERYSGIFRNDGNDVFTEITEQLVPIRTGDAKWGDYDGDGDLDIAICGTDTSGVFGAYVTKIYRNDIVTSTNNPPAPPSDLYAEVNNEMFYFYWDPGSDPETPTASLSYNICIGSESGDIDIVAPMTIVESGNRTIKHYGNAGMNTFYALHGMEHEKLYWRIQTIDGSFIGSAFSEESVLDLNTVGLNSEKETFNVLEIFPNPARESISLKFVSHVAGVADFNVSNTAGQIVLHRRIQLNRGENHLQFPVDRLKTGIYYYNLTSGRETFSGKVLIE